MLAATRTGNTDDTTVAADIEQEIVTLEERLRQLQTRQPLSTPL
jgi:hypothetical protein